MAVSFLLGELTGWDRGSINCLRYSQAQRGGSLLCHELDGSRFLTPRDLSRAAAAPASGRSGYLATDF